jgi:hypothetical protein
MILCACRLTPIQTSSRAVTARETCRTFRLVSGSNAYTLPLSANTSQRPGMREHALFSRDRYATNGFMEPFRKHLRFAWPHGTTDTYELEIKSDLYRFTPLYLHHQSRIECWQMDPDFFNLFPELRAEIPASTPSPSKPLSTGVTFRSGHVGTIYGPHEEDASNLLDQQRGSPSGVIFVS